MHLSTRYSTAGLEIAGSTPFASLDTDDFREMVSALGHGLCVIKMQTNDDGRFVDYVFLETNAAFESQTGLADARGRSMRELRPDHEQHWFDIYGEIAATGRPRRFTAQAAALGRWYDVYAFRIGNPEERLVGILFDDITAMHCERERLEILSTEIQHRSRNQITLLTSLLRLTNADSVEEFRQMLLRRLTALSEVELRPDVHAGGDYANLVRGEMEPYQGGSIPRIDCAGGSVMLDGNTAQCLAVVLHELATNAVKHGALSAAAGKVFVRWWIENGRLRTQWRESGGPAAKAPRRTGVGTSVINRCVKDHLQGDLDFSWAEDGLVCTFTVPLPVMDDRSSAG